MTFETKCHRLTTYVVRLQMKVYHNSFSLFSIKRLCEQTLTVVYKRDTCVSLVLSVVHHANRIITVIEVQYFLNKVVYLKNDLFLLGVLKHLFCFKFTSSIVELARFTNGPLLWQLLSLLWSDQKDTGHVNQTTVPTLSLIDLGRYSPYIPPPGEIKLAPSECVVGVSNICQSNVSVKVLCVSGPTGTNWVQSSLTGVMSRCYYFSALLC